MEVIVKKKIYRQLKRVPQNIRNDILDTIRGLKSFPSVVFDIKKLSGMKNTYRVRIGRYRMLFILEKNKIYVFKVDIRERVY